MPYQVLFAPAAERQLYRLPEAVQPRIVRAAEALANAPRPPGTRKLEGSRGRWRIRVGDYRIVYEIREEALLVLVVRVGHRRDVYRLRQG